MEYMIKIYDKNSHIYIAHITRARVFLSTTRSRSLFTVQSIMSKHDCTKLVREINFLFRFLRSPYIHGEKKSGEEIGKVDACAWLARKWVTYICWETCFIAMLDREIGIRYKFTFDGGIIWQRRNMWEYGGEPQVRNDIEEEEKVRNENAKDGFFSIRVTTRARLRRKRWINRISALSSRSPLTIFATTRQRGEKRQSRL